MMNRTVGIIFLASLALDCCKPVRHTYQPLEPKEIESTRMIFLSFTVQADSSRKSIIRLISKRETEGIIKGNPSTITSPTHLIVSLLDQSGKVTVEEKVEHPLFREVEFINEKNELARKALNLENAEFFVRMKLPLSADRVQVTEVINEKKINSVEFAIK
jgi:hypothetical protein